MNTHTLNPGPAPGSNLTYLTFLTSTQNILGTKHCLNKLWQVLLLFVMAGLRSRIHCFDVCDCKRPSWWRRGAPTYSDSLWANRSDLLAKSDSTWFSNINSTSSNSILNLFKKLHYRISIESLFLKKIFHWGCLIFRGEDVLGAPLDIKFVLRNL